MTIKQSVKNTMDRIGIDYASLEKLNEKVEVVNRFTGVPCQTTPLIAECISKVYSISNDYEAGIRKVNLSDFDRIRYFVAGADSQAYMTCLD